jgi:hypothetical protein
MIGVYIAVIDDIYIYICEYTIYILYKIEKVEKEIDAPE